MRLVYELKLQPQNKDNFEIQEIDFDDNPVDLLSYKKMLFRVDSNIITFVSETDTVDVEKVFKAKNKDIKSKEFKDIQYHIKQAKNIGQGYFDCNLVFENRKEVVFVTFVNDIMTIVDVKSFVDSSVIEVVDNTIQSLYYFIVKNEFAIMPETYYSLKPEDIYNISSGFAKFQVVQKTPHPRVLKQLGNIVYTPSKKVLLSDYKFEIDGRSLVKYTTFDREYIKVDISQESMSLSDLKYENLENIIIVYEVQETGIVFDRMLITSDLNSWNFVNNTSLTSLQEIDEEFKKNYVFKYYKTKIKIGESDTLELLDETILDEINENRVEYSSKVVII